MAPEKKIDRPPKLLLDTFYDLASYESNSRKRAASQLIFGLQNSEDSLAYCVERLVKGLASPRESARLGYSVALTELLKSSSNVSCDEILTLLDKFLSTNGNDAKNNAIGQILCITSLIRSKKCLQEFEKTVAKLNDLITDRPYLEVPWAQAIVALSNLASDEIFRDVLWPTIKERCNAGLDTCTPSSFWIILELDKSHEKFCRKKIKLLRDGDWPPTDEKQFFRIGEILGISVRSIPTGIHPLEKCLLTAMMTGDGFEKFWSNTVCQYLLKNDDKMVSSIGIRMIGETLRMNPNKNQLKSILSIETLEQLLKALLDRRSAARFVRSIAWKQIDAIHEYVISNKANPAIQFLTLKKIVDLSLNFDGVSGSHLVHRLIGGFSTEAAALTTDELIKRLKSNKQRHDQNKNHNLQSSEFLTAVKLLHRIFECSKFSYETAVDYRSKIIRLLIEAAFTKSEFTDLPKSLWIGSNSEIVKNIFMRCLDELCIIPTSLRPNRSKFEFPQESVTILSDIIDSLIDRKQRRLSEKCSVALKPEQERLTLKAAKIFHQLSKSTKSNQADEKIAESKGFLILIGYGLLWFVNEPDAFEQTLEDLLTCRDHSQEPEEPGSDLKWTDKLIDLLLGLLARPQRYIRNPLQIAFHYFCPSLNFANIQPLLKALKPSETDNFLMDNDNEEEEEMDDEQSNEKDDVEKANGDVKADDWSASGDESEADEEEDDEEGVLDASVDPEFKRAIEDALGDAAIHSDTESTASDFTDEAMLKLDESLAAIFRSRRSQFVGADAKKSARDLAEQAQAFRVRCFDLVFVLLNSNPSVEIFTGILLPLLNVANESVRINNQQNVFHRSRQVIERVVHSKTLPTVAKTASKEFLSRLTQSIKDLIEFVRIGCTNPSIQLLASDCLRFLLKYGDSVSDDDGKKEFEEDIKNLFARNLIEYLNDRSCLTPTCIFTAAFQKRPRLFLENLPILIEAAFAENVRPFRRHEACTLINCLLNVNALSCVKEKSDKKVVSAWKQFVDLFHKSVLEMISKQDTVNDVPDVDNEDEKKKSEASSSIKSGDLFEIFILLRSVANLRELVPLRNLQETAFIEIMEKVTDSEKLGTKTGKVGQGRKRVKLSTLSKEIVKKLRGRLDEEKNGGGEDEDEEDKEDEDEKKGAETTTPSPAKRRKTKAF